MLLSYFLSVRFLEERELALAFLVQLKELGACPSAIGWSFKDSTHGGLSPLATPPPHFPANEHTHHIGLIRHFAQRVALSCAIHSSPVSPMLIQGK